MDSLVTLFPYPTKTKSEKFYSSIILSDLNCCILMYEEYNIKVFNLNLPLEIKCQGNRNGWT